MAKPEWGLKRTCLSCGARFYDLRNDPIVCPHCETKFDPEAAVKLKRGRTAVAEDKKKAAKVKEGEEAILETDDDDLDVDGDDESVLEDTSDLDDGDEVAVGGGASDDGDEEN